MDDIIGTFAIVILVVLFVGVIILGNQLNATLGMVDDLGDAICKENGRGGFESYDGVNKWLFCSGYNETRYDGITIRTG